MKKNRLISAIALALAALLITAEDQSYIFLQRNSKLPHTKHGI